MVETESRERSSGPPGPAAGAEIPLGPAARALLGWYRRHRRALPWREDPSPYRVWLSEVMLQQTQAATVIPYFHRFLERFPRLEDLARAREEEVLALWSGLGYYRRARDLLRGARQVAERFAGQFPRDYREALSLPGVGPYTAAAVLSIAYNLPYPVVDGNVERVLCRFLRLEGNPRRAAPARRLREVLAAWMPPRRAGEFNQALMELGALVCLPAAPRCPVCPLARACGGRRYGDASRFPELPRRRAVEPIDLEVGVLRRGDRVLLERARGLGFLEGLWLFPLSDPRKEAGIEVVLARKLGGRIEVSQRLEPVAHSITYRRFTLYPKLLAARGIPRVPRSGFRWAALRELGQRVPAPSLSLKIARRLEERGGPA